MARGVDGDFKGAVPPRRNPFRQEIADSSEDGTSFLSEERGSRAKQAFAQEAEELTGQIESSLNNYFSEEIKSYMQPSEIKDERIIKWIDKGSVDGSQDVDLELKIQKHNNQILDDISAILEDHAGDDLLLAEKLENLLLNQGKSLFYIEEVQIEGNYFDGSKYWVHALDEAALGRFLRNAKRTLLLHRQDQAADASRAEASEEEHAEKARGEELSEEAKDSLSEEEGQEEWEKAKRERELIDYRLRYF